jgi:hypothetical protein
MTTINLSDINGIGSIATPSGAIILWYGSIASIPSGWVLCDGNNGTPDLRNKFVIGAYSDTSSVAYTTVEGTNTKSGGTKDAVVVSHTHTASVNDPGHFHRWGGGGNMQAGNDNGGSSVNGGSSNHATSTVGTGISVGISTEGTSSTNQNLPPYYALAYIMKA